MVQHIYNWLNEANTSFYSNVSRDINEPLWITVIANILLCLSLMMVRTANTMPVRFFSATIACLTAFMLYIPEIWNNAVYNRKDFDKTLSKISLNILTLLSLSIICI